MQLTNLCNIVLYDYPLAAAIEPARSFIGTLMLRVDQITPGAKVRLPWTLSLRDPSPDPPHIQLGGGLIGKVVQLR